MTDPDPIAPEIGKSSTGALHRLFAAREGGVAVAFGVALPLLLGFAGLGIEIGEWLVAKRTMQGVADSAAFSAALSASTDQATLQGYGRAMAAANGWTNGVDNVVVNVFYPPQTGRLAGVANYVEVDVSQPQPAMFSAFLQGVGLPSSIAAHAVAGIDFSTYCALALDPTASGAFSSSQGGSANFNGCGFAVASNSATAFTMRGGSQIIAGSGVVHGGDQFLNNNSPTIPAGMLKTYVSSSRAFTDPYGSHSITWSGSSVTLSDGNGSSQTISALGTSTPAGDRPVPPVSTATCNGSTGYSTGTNGTFTLTPGIYPCGINIHNSAIVKLTPGIYVIDRGAFQASGSTSIQGLSGPTATGVTIVLTSSKGNNWATISLGNSSVTRITAPTTGPTAGLVLWDDKNAPQASQTPITGGATFDVTGTVYMPSQNVTFNDGANITSPCLQLIANRISFTGGSDFHNACAGTGVSNIGGNTAILVE